MSVVDVPPPLCLPTLRPSFNTSSRSSEGPLWRQSLPPVDSHLSSFSTVEFSHTCFLTVWSVLVLSLYLNYKSLKTVAASFPIVLFCIRCGIAPGKQKVLNMCLFIQRYVSTPSGYIEWILEVSSLQKNRKKKQSQLIVTNEIQMCI